MDQITEFSICWIEDQDLEPVLKIQLMFYSLHTGTILSYMLLVVCHNIQVTQMSIKLVNNFCDWISEKQIARAGRPPKAGWISFEEDDEREESQGGGGEIAPGKIFLLD